MAAQIAKAVFRTIPSCERDTVSLQGTLVGRQRIVSHWSRHAPKSQATRRGVGRDRSRSLLNRIEAEIGERDRYASSERIEMSYCIMIALHAMLPGRTRRIFRRLSCSEACR